MDSNGRVVFVVSILGGRLLTKNFMQPHYPLVLKENNPLRML